MAMTIYDELKARGLIAQVTDEAHISDMINNGKAVFYIGFDPTADSLHVGHFMALCLMKRLQMAGNKPIALLGGGTGMIGDPSGRSDLRQVLTKETIEQPQRRRSYAYTNAEGNTSSDKGRECMRVKITDNLIGKDIIYKAERLNFGTVVEQGINEMGQVYIVMNLDGIYETKLLEELIEKKQIFYNN